MQHPRGSKTSSRKRHQQLRPWIQAIILVVAASVLILGSPYAMLEISHLFDSEEWQLISDVGQSYTGIGTVLSAVALLAVARSIRLQAKQLETDRIQAIYETQRELMTLALDRPSLLGIFWARNDLYDTEEERPRAYAYSTLWLRYWWMQHATGHFTDEQLERALIVDYLNCPFFREHWRQARDYWYMNTTDTSGIRFAQIVDRALDAVPDS